MEILIVGVVVVALMAWASTKIKKSAAEAFDAEEIETETFRISKPEGFIHPLNDDSGYAFEAYTKDLGTNEARNMRRARVTLRVFTNLDFLTVCRDTKKASRKVIYKRFDENQPENRKTFLLQGEREVDEVKIFSNWKVVENREQRKIYELQTDVLEEYEEEFAERINEMISSFEVK